MSRFLSSYRWALPLVLLLALLATLHLRRDADHRLNEIPAVALNARTGEAAALDGFDAWLTGGRNPEKIARGVALAQARREALKELIQADPQAALERAVPYSLRRQLPAEIVRLLEMPVSTTADLDVEQACGGPGGRSSRRHWLMLGGQRLQVFTYGARAEVMTKQKLSVHGIAIDDVMAMRDEPLRKLPAEEVADRGLTGRVSQLGIRLLGVGSDAALKAARQQLRETEETLGPTALPAYRELALGQMEGMFPLAMQDGAGGTEDDLPPPVAASAWTEGAKTMLYIRARFADELPTYEPVTLSTAQARQGEAEAFWQENSYGKSTLSTTYTAVVTLPKNGGDYVNDFNALHLDARAAALAANPAWNHANFSFYTVITNYATNAQGNGFAYTGIAQLGGKASHLLRNFISVRTASHEYGHNLGLNHSEYWLTDSPSPIGEDSNPGGYAGDAADDERIEYGHRFAVMSGQDGIGDLDSGRAHYAASDKNRLDWLATGDGDIVTTTTSNTYRLYRHDVMSADFGTMTNGVARAIKINLPATDPTGFANPYKYWLNYRTLPTNGIAENWLPHGLQVDWRRDQGPDQFRAVQLDMTPYSRDTGPYGSPPGPNGDNDDKEDGVLLVGRTFSDTGADIHFTPIAKGGANPNEWLDVVVNIGTQGTNTPPQIQNLTVTNSNPAVGQVINFIVTATDPDSDALAYHWDLGDNTVQSTQLNLNTRGKQWSAAGYYVVRAEVSDMKGGKATAIRVISVGSPANNGNWTNASGGSWATNANWVGNLIAGGEGNTADFSILNPTSDTTVTLDADRAIGNLVFGDSNPGSPATWFLVNGTGGSLILAGGSPTITVNPLGTGKFANISARLSGFNGFTKNGTGNLILNNSTNTLTGPVIINAGNVQLNSASLSDATTVAINAGSLVVATSATNAVGGTITFGGGNLQFNNPPGSDYSVLFSTAANQPYRISVGLTHEATFNSNLASPGGTLTKLGTGTLILAAANGYTGGTTLSVGTLRSGNANSLGSGPLAITGNATLQAGIAATLSNAVSIATGITGTLDTNGYNTTLGGTLTGQGNLAKIGTNTLNITGGAAGKNLSGSININAGALAIDNVNPNPGIQSFANMNGAITVASGAGFNFSQSFTADNLDNNITLSGPGVDGLGALNLWRNATAIGAITLAADSTISHTFNTATISGSITGTDRNLTLATLTASQPGMTVSGPIQLGAGGITVTGAANSGTFSIRLSGYNSYSGETRVASGTLMLTGNARFNDSSTVRIDFGAIINLDFAGTDNVAALFLGGVSKPNGTYGSLTSTATHKSADFLGNGILQVGAAHNYASWAASQAPPVTGGENGDDDNDGVKNLVEYALTDGGERGVFSGTTLTFAKRGLPYGNDLTYVIETSGTLDANSWSPAVTHGPSEMDSLISYDFAPVTGTPKKFARLRAVKSP